MIEIREIQEIDNLQLAVIIRSVFEEFQLPKTGSAYYNPATDDIYGQFRHPGSACFVAVDGESVLGGCGIYPTNGLPEGYVELVKFYLSPDHRGKGIGKQLMKQCIESAKMLSYTVLYLETFHELSDAISMYERLGFRYLQASLCNCDYNACNVYMLEELADIDIK